MVFGFYIIRGLTTIPLMRILCNSVFSKSQNAGKVRTLCRDHSHWWPAARLLTKVIIHKSNGAVSLVEQFTIEYVAWPINFLCIFILCNFLGWMLQNFYFYFIFTYLFMKTWKDCVHSKNHFNIWFIFWETRWFHEFILKFTDL